MRGVGKVEGNLPIAYWDSTSLSQPARRSLSQSNDRPIALLKSDRPSHPDPRSRNVCKTELPSAAIA